MLKRWTRSTTLVAATVCATCSVSQAQDITREIDILNFNLVFESSAVVIGGAPFQTGEINFAQVGTSPGQITFHSGSPTGTLSMSATGTFSSVLQSTLAPGAFTGTIDLPNIPWDGSGGTIVGSTQNTVMKATNPGGLAISGMGPYGLIEFPQGIDPIKNAPVGASFEGTVLFQDDPSTPWADAFQWDWGEFGGGISSHRLVCGTVTVTVIPGPGTVSGLVFGILALGRRRR